jgi:hypothetical protein
MPGRDCRRYFFDAPSVVSVAMHSRLFVAAMIAATPILALSPAAFPEGSEAGCERATAGARQVQRQFMSLMRRRDSDAAKVLAEYGVTRVKSREVKQVNDDVICESAALAYGRAVGDDSQGRRVHILHIGGRFVVLDPDDKRTVTFDSTFAQPVAVVTE